MTDFLIFAAEKLKEKADKEASYGMQSAAKTYKAAAQKYRQAADRYPNRKEEFISLVKECEEKANAMPTVEQKPVIMGHIPSPKPESPKKTVKYETVNEAELQEALEELNSLVGLDSVKEKIASFVKLIAMGKKREAFGLRGLDGYVYNLAFIGNPGTGKSMLAKIVGKLYRALGILSKGEVVEVDRSDLVAGYVGQTAIKTKKVIDEAVGNVLFIDEIYNLTNGSEHDFGIEVLNTLLAEVENRKDDLVLIAAGYPEPMINFLKRFDGICLHLFGTLGCWDEENIFEDRNGNIFKFEDYTSEELYKIFQKLCEKYQYILEPAAERAVKEHFETLYAKRDKCFGNAREVRNFFQDIVSNQAMRMSKIGDLTQKDLMTVIREDIPKPKKT